MGHRRRVVGGQRWFVYMLECERGVLYTGVAVDVAARLAAHRAGRGAAFTRANPPRRVIAARRCAGRSEALVLEAALKKLRRPDKLRWARHWPWRAGVARSR